MKSLVESNHNIKYSLETIWRIFDSFLKFTTTYTGIAILPLLILYCRGLYRPQVVYIVGESDQDRKVRINPSMVSLTMYHDDEQGCEEWQRQPIYTIVWKEEGKFAHYGNWLGNLLWIIPLHLSRYKSHSRALGAVHPTKSGQIYLKKSSSRLTNLYL